MICASLSPAVINRRASSISDCNKSPVISAYALFLPDSPAAHRRDQDMQSGRQKPKVIEGMEPGVWKLGFPSLDGTPSRILQPMVTARPNHESSLGHSHF